MHNYKNLDVWKRSVELATTVYKRTENYPDKEKFGLTSQIRRAVISISSNIAEGAGRNSDKEFRIFLNYSLGSTFELETQVLISKNLGYLDDASSTEILNENSEIQRILYTLIKKFK